MFYTIKLVIAQNSKMINMFLSIKISSCNYNNSSTQCTEELASILKAHRDNVEKIVKTELTYYKHIQTRCNSDPIAIQD